MEIIAKLSEMIEDEVCGAEEYICYANKFKGVDNELAKTFYELSNVEMGHMAILHKQVVKLINAAKSSDKDVSESMLAMYDMLHKKHVEKAAMVKIMQEEFTG